MLYQGMGRRTRALILFLCMAAGCSRQHVLNRERARSELRVADSFASEFQMFLDFVREGRSTRPYAEGYLEYLQDAVTQRAKDLEQAQPDKDTQGAVHECLADLWQLRGEIAAVRNKMSGGANFTLEQQEVGQMRNRLKRAMSRL